MTGGKEYVFYCIVKVFSQIVLRPYKGASLKITKFIPFGFLAEFLTAVNFNRILFTEYRSRLSASFVLL